MKARTEEFKQAISTFGRQIDSKITYTLNNETIVLTKEDLYSVTPTFQSNILKSAMKQLDIDSNVSIPIGTILRYEFGLKVNGEYEYINYGNYIVKNVEKQEDTRNYKITCYDKMLLSMKDYVKLPITYPITIKNYISALCEYLGITFANRNDNFVNSDKIIPSELYLDSSGNSLGYTFRDIFDELAQVTASTICINKDDALEVRYITDINDMIDEEYFKNVNVRFGEKYGPINSIVLSRSAESDNVYLRDEESVAKNGLCELKIIDNQIMNFNNRDDFLPEMLGKLNGLEYYLNDFSSTGICYYDMCDRYNVKIEDNIYSCVMFNDEILVTQGLEENIYTELPIETQTDYTKADKTDRRINQTYLIVDKQNQKIESVITQTDKQNEKIAKVTQTVEELNSKISDIADITTSNEDNDALVEFEGINQSEPIRVVIRPIGENISYLYPSDNLYPSDDLFLKVRTLRFKNTKTSEIFDYELPADLLYYDSEHYDEFILDYDGQSCVVNKRVGYNADGTTYVLEDEKTLEFEYPRISLTDGDYKVSVLGYDTAYLFVRLMAQNIYTTQFATRAELSSEISQTSQEINLSVDKKLESYSTTTEMNSAIQITASGINQTVSQKVGKNEVISTINQSAEAVTINANKVNISGVINAINNNTTTTIDGDKISTGSITANQIAANTINASKVASDVITTSNFSAQKINADNITSGTINADKINGGTITASAINLGGGTFTANTSGTISAVSGSIGGFTIDGTSGLAGSYGTIRPNGNLLLYPNYGSARYVLSSAMTFNAQTGVIIASNCNGNMAAPSANIDLKACSGASVYLGCMETADGINERSSVTCRNGELRLKSAGAIYANGVAIGGSSSKATKENITDLTQEQKDEVYELIKNIPLKQYDYKEQYGKPFNYGFLIEDIENTKLNDLLHITQSDINKDIKAYCSEDLTRLNLIMIKELMNKVETLETKIKELESDNNG